MKRLVAAFALVLAAPALAQSAPAKPVPAVPGKHYAVLFEVAHDAQGRLIQFTLNRVIDPTSDSTGNVAIVIPPAFVDGAKARSSAPLNVGRSDHYFTYYIFDAARPADVTIDKL